VEFVFRWRVIGKDVSDAVEKYFHVNIIAE
jgi:hypothetical protein